MVRVCSMVEQHSDNSAETPTNSGTASRRINKQTAFGEPLWVDTLKTLGVVATMTLITIVLGGALALMIIAPWGRASPECSIWCVLDQAVESWFSDESS